MSPDSLMMFQCPTSSVSVVIPEVDILLTLVRGIQVDDLEPPGLITSLPIPACQCLWPIHCLQHKIICSGGSRYGHKGYGYL